MRVPEAIEALDVARRLSLDDSTWRQECARILDSVWLTAYEEGELQVFGPSPEAEPESDHNGRHSGHNVIDIKHSPGYRPRHGSNPAFPT